MSFNFNQATLVGRLTKDPETREINSKSTKTQFTLAVSRGYKKDKKETDFIPISIWGKMAELSKQILRKGTPVLVWGRIQISDYEKDNQKRRYIEIVADNFQVLEPKSLSS